MASLVFAPDTVLAGRYRLVRPIGEGGMGMVWAASHVVTRRAVALKLLKAQSPELIRRFLREARVAGAIQHPNVVPIHDVLQLEDGTPVMVMDLLSGESLAGRLERDRRLALPELARLMLPVVSAVGSAHALGIVHRDLKPDNVFLCKSDSGAVTDVKVLDFGIAKLTATEGDAAKTAGLTTTGSMLGTPYYMAPEQVFGERNVDHRVDVWALGVILYEALSGHKPIDGENLGQIFKAITLDRIVPLEQHAPHLPPAITDLVGRMLARDRDLRPLDLREVFAVLGSLTEASVPAFGAAVEAIGYLPSDPPPASPSSRPPPSDAPPSRPITPPDGRAMGRPFDPTLGRAGFAQTDGGAAVTARPARGSVAGAAVAALALVVLLGAGTWRLVTRPDEAPPERSAPAAATAPAAGSEVAPSPSAPAAPTVAPSAVAPPDTAVAASSPAHGETARPGRAAPPATAPATARPVDSSKPAGKPLPGGVHGESPY